MKCRIFSLIVITLVLLAACTSAPVVAPVDTATREAEARAAIERGDFLAARDLYQTLTADTDGDERRRYQVELARAQVGLGNPEGALATLAAVPPPLPEGLNASVMAVRADALFALGNTVEAVGLLVDREIWLNSSAEILDNQTRIWNGLALPQSQAAAGTRTGDSVIDGWLALAPLAQAGTDNASFLAGLVDWRESYGNHPAASGILAERLAAGRGDGMRPARVALLLPLGAQGELRLQAAAIREGFVAAHLAGDHGDSTAIRIYDTAESGVVESYRAAQRDGSDFIVGPLLPDQVEQVLPEASFIPTLALNVAATAPAAANFFQYALSLDDEIEAIATRAIAEGHETAVILHGRNPRGRTQAQRFIEAFESRGGQILATDDFAADSVNLSTPIEQSLNIDRSETRYSRLAANLGLGIEFEPRRRADVDMIFLQSAPPAARVLVPLLEVNGAGDIPVYATSDVYDPGRAAGEPDLEGLIFPDLPLLIDPTGGGAAAADLLTEFGSENIERFRRLFAFGFDAYALADTLYAGGTARWPLAGVTGELYLGDNGRIRRLLPFAEFRGGRPQAADAGANLLSAR